MRLSPRNSRVGLIASAEALAFGGLYAAAFGLSGLAASVSGHPPSSARSRVPVAARRRARAPCQTTLARSRPGSADRPDKRRKVVTRRFSVLINGTGVLLGAGALYWVLSRISAEQLGEALRVV